MSYVYKNRIKLLLAIIFGSPSISNALDSLNVSHIGRLDYNWQGRKVAVSDDYAYVVGNGLRVIDISDPTNQVEVATLYLETEQPSDIAIDGNYAYISAYGGIFTGMFVVDISNPLQPQEVARFATTEFPNRLEISGSNVFICAFNEFHVVDISNPLSPVEIGFCTTINDFAHDITVCGDFAYIAMYGQGLCIVDISVPSSPFTCGTYLMGAWCSGVEVAGDIAYIAYCINGLLMIDVSDPYNPSLLNTYISEAPIDDVKLNGNLAYIHTFDGKLRVIDITNALQPVEIGFISTHWVAANLTYADSFIYIMEFQPAYNALRIIDVSNPEIPTETSLYATGYLQAVEVVEDLAFSVMLRAGLLIADISIPEYPVFVGTYTPTDNDEFNDLIIYQEHVFLVSYLGGLRILDVSTPEFPVLAAEYNLSTAFWDIEIESDFAYITTLDSGLIVLNVSDYSNIFKVGSCPLESFPGKLFLQGFYAYVACTQAGLRVVDISDPFNPIEVSFLPLPGLPNEITVSGDFAYVSAKEAGLRIINVSDPQNTYEAAHFETPFSATDVEINGNTLALSDQSAVRILDVSNPENPIESGYYSTDYPSTGSLDIRDVYFESNYLYAANYNYFDVFDVSEALQVNDQVFSALPLSAELINIYPNPFNPTTTIAFGLPVTSEVDLKVYDIQGREVAELAQGCFQAGYHSLKFDGTGFSSGVYFVRLDANNFRQIRKMILIK